MTQPIPTRAEIADRLLKLADEMQDVGAAMDYFGGFDAEMAEHGRELVGAGAIARQWAEHIKAGA
jgi:hypothetical protein